MYHSESGIKRIMFILIAVAVCLGVYAKEEENSEVAQMCSVTVPVKDEVTRLKIDFSCHILMADKNEPEDRDKDTYIKTVDSSGEIRFMAKKNEKYILVVLERELELQADGSYKSKINLDRFEPQEYELELPDDAENEYVAPPVLMKRKRPAGQGERMVELDEFTFTASKVLFYHDGDTLVYDATAFVLAEGSMLDNLLQKMPGVELSANGEIKVNGKRVDKLLINGKEIFNGQNELVIQN